MFQEFLDDRGFNCIPITEEERLGGHLNVVVTQRAEKAIGFQKAERIAGEMGKRGWILDRFPADGTVCRQRRRHCMTCPLLVE